MVGGRGRKRGRGYIGGGIHSAENHRGTFRGAPVREETREKERDEGKKARELVASMKLKQKTWGNTSCRSERTATHAHAPLIFPPSRLHSHLSSLSLLSFSLSLVLQNPTYLSPSVRARKFVLFPAGRSFSFFFFFFLFFFLSFITRRRTRSTVEITRRRLLGYFFEWRRLVSIVHRI